jgi:hypothetical protein
MLAVSRCAARSISCGGDLATSQLVVAFSLKNMSL